MLAFSTWLPSVFSVLRLPLPNLRLHLYEVNAVLIISNTFFLSILELFVHDFFQNLQKVNTLQISHLPSHLYFVDFFSRQQVFSWLPYLTSNMLRGPCFVVSTTIARGIAIIFLITSVANYFSTTPIQKCVILGIFPSYLSSQVHIWTMELGTWMLEGY